MSPNAIQVHWSGEFSWNVTAAEELVAGREPTLCDIAPWVAQLTSATINDAHWPSVDLTRTSVICGQLWVSCTL